jgi:pimeloyl-ACP methyl ester carboxylesterase
VAVGKTTELFVPSDFNIRVTHAPATQSQAIVYLPGMCGNPKGADPWSDIAAQHGTLIVVRANVKCPDRPGYKWPQDVTLIQERIRAALRRVQGSRDGLLNVETPILVGYSQGAHRAERLAEAYPSMYRRVVLGGPPTAPEPDSLAHALAVAVLGGELENSDHMQAGTAALREAGLHARFFLLPGAYHGGYGPDGRHVMTQVFGFLDVGK